MDVQPVTHSASQPAAGAGSGTPSADLYHALRVVAMTGLVLGLAYFLWWGVWRALTNSGDLAIGYSAARAWLAGSDPYQAANLERIAESAGAEPTVVHGLGRLLDVYVPVTLPVFAPIAIVSWPIARLLGLLLNLAALALVVGGLIHLLDWPWRSIRAIGLTAVLLAFAPVHTTIASGQVGLVSTAGVVAALLLTRSGREILAGLLIGLAAAVKVQVGLPFLVYLVWRGRWRAAAAAGIVLAALAALSVVRLELAGIDWLASWSANMSALSSPGGLNDPSPLNADSYSLINLQYLLSRFVSGQTWADLVTVAAVGAGGLALIGLGRGRERRQDLLALSIVSVLTLLVTYHRHYDAVLLAIPIAWAFDALGSPRWRQAVVALVLCADFVLPFQVGLYNLEQAGRLPGWLTGGWLWTDVLMTQHVWALLALAVVLLVALARQRAAPRQAAVPSGNALDEFERREKAAEVPELTIG